MTIHPTAVVSDKAKLAKDVKIGPYVVIEDEVAIGPGCVISAHAHICSGTSMGKDCKIHTGAVLGDEPQDVAFEGKESFVKIGQRNIFREYVTVHRGTKEGTSTVIGNDNYFMALSHVAHNCHIANNVIICNNSLLAGYVSVEDKAFISAACLIHQFVRVGALSFIAGGVRLTKDIPPFMMSDNNNIVSSFNVVGLKRAGFDIKVRSAIKEAYRLIYRSGLNISNALAEIEKTAPGAEAKQLIEFIRSSKRGVCLSHSNRNLED
jgi:UDP-N-acetylglucosamine acyltransferase